HSQRQRLHARHQRELRADRPAVDLGVGGAAHRLRVRGHLRAMERRQHQSPVTEVLGAVAGPSDAFAYVGHTGTLRYMLEHASQESFIAPVLQSFVDKHIASGVVALVANKDGFLALEKAGYANLADKTPMRDDALFLIASMSKSLTGTALMMLVDEGKVSLDDPVDKYLPEFKGQMVADPDGKEAPHPPKHPITVREIMDHTSGLILAS
ncbi:class A beta-lactamase-related serine hydrolase, partial [Lacticaseibacillus rhamnosus]